MVASKGSTIILPLSLWGHISFNHSIIVTAEFNSIGLKRYLISSPKRFSRNKFICWCSFNSIFFHVYLLQISFFLVCKFYASNFLVRCLQLPNLVWREIPLVSFSMSCFMFFPHYIILCFLRVTIIDWTGKRPVLSMACELSVLCPLAVDCATTSRPCSRGRHPHAARAQEAP
jgi:hypothetical protein